MSKRFENNQAFGKEMRIMPSDFLKLRLEFEQKNLEEIYRSTNFSESLIQTRWVMGFGVILFGIFGLVDAVIQPDLLVQFLIIRFAVVIPLGIFVIAASFTPYYQRVHQFLLFFVFLIGGLGIELMIVMSNPPATYLYYAGICQVVVIMFTLIPLRFRLALFCAWLIVICYWIVAIWFTDTPREILINNSLFYISTNLISMFAGYLIQMKSRRMFLLNHLLRQEKLKVEALNSALESRVAERTEDLEAVNRKLAKSELLHRDIIESINDAIYKVTPAGIVTYVSPVMESITGFTPGEVQGKSFTQFVHREDLPRLKKRFLALSKGEIIPMEYRMNHKNGGIVWVRSSSNPVYKNGVLTEFRGVLSDVTKAKRLEQQLEQVRRMESIGTLAGGIAHDFNNILASILGYAELSIKKLDKGTQLESYINAIVVSGRRARDLIQQILTFARKADAAKESVQVGTIVQESVKMLESTISPAIQIHAEILSAACVYAVPAQIQQMILNMMTNAIHAMESKGGKLVVRLEDSFLNDQRSGELRQLPEGDYLRVKVMDTGEGIDKKILDSIFEPYFTTKEVGKGTGLGLAVVHGIVKDCGGVILVESEISKGTVFTIYLPTLQLTKEVNAYIADLEMLKGGEHILIVEDDTTLLNMTEDSLKELGYRVTSICDGSNALKFFEMNADDIHLVLTDIAMPGMNGKDLALRMLSIKPGIPIILLTGFSYAISKTVAKKMGVRGFFYKPVSTVEIARKIRSLLDE